MLTDFDKIYPDYIQELSNIHWTPTEIIKTAVSWLHPSHSSRVLDIGSGVGKFCIIGAALSTAQFTGVEIRGKLVATAQEILDTLVVNNVNFINANITQINFKNYDSFYYYNPFCEHLATDNWIDKTLDFSEENLNFLEEYIYQQFIEMKKHTKVITYQSASFILPKSYHLEKINNEGTLALFVKQ